MASEPARRLLLLPSSVSGVISVLIYICVSLLRVTKGSELTSEDDKHEPKIGKTSSKKQKPYSSIIVYLLAQYELSCNLSGSLDLYYQLILPFCRVMVHSQGR